MFVRTLDCFQQPVQIPQLSSQQSTWNHLTRTDCAFLREHRCGLMVLLLLAMRSRTGGWLKSLT